MADVVESESSQDNKIKETATEETQIEVLQTTSALEGLSVSSGTTSRAAAAGGSTTTSTDPKKRQLPHPEKSFAVQINSFGETSVFTWSEIATPEIVGPHDVIVKVVNSSINPIDWKVRKGFMQVLEKPTFPHVLGRDFSGVVVAKGNSVNRFFLNDKVFGAVPYGAYA
ncbi:829_t:CDS:2, partial [Ambispora gerdemannii]